MNYKLKNGFVIDPVQNLDCIKQDVCIKDGLIVSNFDLEIQKLKYIYGDQLKKHVLDKPSRVKDIKHIFRNRVVIQNEDVKDISNYPLLSSVPVFDAFNNLIQSPLFDKVTFNPLIFNFNFNSKRRLIYRVDNTNYLIIIKSKFN